jgi:uncharacterized protein YdgA (DUF945 family)
MKRWIVFGLITLAVIVLVSPGIVGQLAERNLRNSISWAEDENEDLVVTEERFERGWFTAKGRHRIELDHDLFGSASGTPGEMAALVIETRIDHGLVPLTSMARDAGSLQPALASTVSVISLDLGHGRVVELPGRLTSRIGLTGATVSRYELEAGSFKDEGVDLEWQGADVRFSIDAAASAASYEGRIEPLRYTGGSEAWSLGAIAFEGEQQRTRYGFSTGDIALRMADASLDVLIGGASGFGSLAFDASSEISDDRLSGVSSLDIEGLVMPELGAIDFGLDVAVNRLDAASVQRIREALDAAGETGEPMDELDSVYPRIEKDLQTLLAAGAELRVDRFVLSLPQGEVTAAMRFDLPASDPGPDFSWPSLLLALTASAEMRVPAALVEMAREANPEQAGALVAMGILKREGDVYVVKGEYAQGLVTVNGAPLPIPLGAFPGRTSATD